MKLIEVRDKSRNNNIVAKMPLFCWWLTGIKYKNLGANFLMSFKWDYGTNRPWFESLKSGFLLWKDCTKN